MQTSSSNPSEICPRAEALWASGFASLLLERDLPELLRKTAPGPPPPASARLPGLCPLCGRAVLTAVVSEFAFVCGGRVDHLSFFLQKVSLLSHSLGLRETNISPSPVSIQKTNPKRLGFYRKGTALHSVGGDASQGQTRRASARRPSGVSPDSTSVSACGRSGSVAAVGAGGLAPCCGPVRLTRRKGGSNAQGHE